MSKQTLRGFAIYRGHTITCGLVRLMFGRRRRGPEISQGVHGYSIGEMVRRYFSLEVRYGERRN